jgi:Tfp pilus assembly protein PilF
MTSERYERGDRYSRVNHQDLGKILNSVGDCLCFAGEFAAARPWFERAVAEYEKSDVRGLVDHESLGKNLHRVGECLNSVGEFAAARPWFERAIAQRKQDDLRRLAEQVLAQYPSTSRTV